jgi:hypothetical protein
MGGMGEWVLFDYGGVLCRDQSARDRRAIEAAVGVEDPDRFWAGYWSLRRPYDEGTLSPADYWSRVVGTDVGDRLDAIEAVDVASWSHPYEETLALGPAAGRSRRPAGPAVELPGADGGRDRRDELDRPHPGPVLQLPARADQAGRRRSTRRC